MSNTVSRKAIVGALNAKADIHDAVGNVNAAGELRAWSNRIERGDFSLPSEGAEGRYREALEQIARADDSNLIEHPHQMTMIALEALKEDGE